MSWLGLAFIAQVDEKLKELQRKFKAVYLQSSKEEAKQRKSIKPKLARMENVKTRVLQKVLPRVDHDEANITIGVEEIFIAALVRLSRREAKV